MLAISYLASPADNNSAAEILEMQRQVTSSFAEHNGFKVKRTYVDHLLREPAELRDRPNLVAATEHALRIGAGILVADFRTLGYSLSFLEQFLELGVPLLVVRAGHDGGGIHICSDAAAGVRTWRGRTSKRVKVVSGSGRTSGNLKNLPEARAKAIQSTVAAADRFARQMDPLIRELRGSGYGANRQIAAILNMRRIPTARGSTWHATTVGNLIKRIEALENGPQSASDSE